MIFIRIIALLGLIMSMPAHSQDCDTVAIYARSVMLLRNVGSPIPNVTNFPPSFPREAIIEEVMNIAVIDPKIASLKMYVECVDVGYYNFPRRLREMKLERMEDKR